MRYSCELHPNKYVHLHTIDMKMPKKDTYYWYIANFTNDMDKFKVIHAFEKAFNEWQRVFDLIPPIGRFLHLKSTSKISEADIIISFGGNKHTMYPNLTVCPFNFDGNDGVLAHSWSLITKQPYGGQIHCDDSENWGDMDKDLFTVILHELGHVFDLGHSKDKNAVMYYAYTGIKHTLTSDDIKGIRIKFSKIKAKLAKLSGKKSEIDCSCTLTKLLKQIFNRL